jgi:predicted ATPase
MKPGILILAGFLTVLLIPNQTDAADITWTNTAGGDWSDAANWDPNQVPGASDDVIITSAGSYTVTVHNAGTVNSLVLGDALSSPVLRIEGNASYNGYLTLANSFTNIATVELVSTFPNHYAKLTVNNGSLVNDATGSILVSDGGGSGRCTLEAELDNRGAVTVQYPLTVYKNAVLAHTNSGMITASADISITLNSSTFNNTGSMTFSGGAGLDIISNLLDPVFTTSGALDLGAGSLDVSGGTFNYDGTITGTGTQSYDNVTLNLSSDLSNAAAEIVLYRSTVNGPGALINAAGRAMLLHHVICNADLENRGDLACWRDVDLNGGFDSPAGSSIKVEGSGSYNANLTLANSFTNTVTLELTSTHASRTATLAVDNGPLVNDTSGTVLVSSGAGGGKRTLAAELDNRGALTVEHLLEISKTGSAHTNSGSIELSADLILTVNSGSFDNSGSMTFAGNANLDLNGNGRMLSTFSTTGTLDLGMGNMDVYGNTFNYAGTVTGISTQSYDNTTLNLTPDLSNAATEIVLYRSTVNGPGALINAAGRELLLNQVTCNADLDNHGDLTCWRNVDLNGGFVSPAGSAIKVEGSGSYNANLTLANSFTNTVTLELISTHASRTATLAVDNGPLVNDTSGTVLVSPGAGGGKRTLAAELDNRGTLTVDHLFEISKTGSAHINSGVINSSADLILTVIQRELRQQRQYNLYRRYRPGPQRQRQVDINLQYHRNIGSGHGQHGGLWQHLQLCRNRHRYQHPVV